jgi:hypothetical protein
MLILHVPISAFKITFTKPALQSMSLPKTQYGEPRFSANPGDFKPEPRHLISLKMLLPPYLILSTELHFHFQKFKYGFHQIVLVFIIPQCLVVEMRLLDN